MALSASAQTRDDRRYGSMETNEVANGDVVHRSAHACLKAPNNGTAAEAGRIGPYTGAKGEIYMGEAVGLHDPAQVDGSYGAAPSDSVTGNSSASPKPATALNWEGRVLERQTITLTDAKDVTKLVYLADDNTYTLTPQTRLEPIGEVRKFNSTTSGDILVYSYAQRRAKAGVRRIWLSPGVAKAVTGSAGDLITGFPMPFHGHLLTIGYLVTTGITDGGGAITTSLSAEIGGTDVTNGGVALATGAAGAYVVGSAFASAADAYFSRGDLLDIELSSGTAPDAGAVAIFVDVMELAGS